MKKWDISYILSPYFLLWTHIYNKKTRKTVLTTFLFFLLFLFLFLEIEMMLPVVEDSKEVFETTPIAPEITIMEEYMQDLNKILLVDETKLYNEKPCKDSGSVLSFDVDKWKNEHPQKLLTHLGQLCNLDDSSRSNFLLAKLIE